MIVAYAVGGAGSNKNKVTNKVTDIGIPMGASGKLPINRGSKPSETTKVTRKAEDDFYRTGNFFNFTK